MTQSIALNIPDSIAEKYQSAEELRQELFTDIIIRAFQKGDLTLRESAELLKMNYEEFLEWLGEHQIPFINASEKGLSQSYNEFEAFMQTYKKP